MTRQKPPSTARPVSGRLHEIRRAVVLTLVPGVLLALCAVLTGTVNNAANAAIFGRPTIVSLTFDDANANQMTADTILTRYGLKGTFYVNSGYLGAPGYMTRANLDTLASHGQEIGGHSVTHADLPTLPADEVKRQVCNDRAALLGMGFAVRSFAYPFANANPSVEAAVRDCGYNSGRGLGDLRTPRDTECSGCPVAATLPPANPYWTDALGQVESSWTLNDLKNSVTRAERVGGWVQFTFHNVCASGCEMNVTPRVLEQFAQWLAVRPLLYNTSVRKVGDVVGGAVQPVVAGPMPAPVGPGENGVRNPGMETLNADGSPMCWMKGGYGSNTATLGLVSPGLTGNVAGQVSVSNYVDGDAKWLPAFDLGGCSPTVTPGHTYSLRQWYTSTGVTQFSVYLRNSSGMWSYWTSSPWFHAAPTTTQAVWTTPEIPAGYTGLSFGLTVFNNGSLVTDDASMYDVVGAPDPDAAQVPQAATLTAQARSAAPAAAHAPGRKVVRKGHPLTHRKGTTSTRKAHPHRSGSVRLAR